VKHGGGSTAKPKNDTSSYIPHRFQNEEGSDGQREREREREREHQPWLEHRRVHALLWPPASWDWAGYKTGKDKFRPRQNRNCLRAVFHGRDFEKELFGELRAFSG
jgi:hypothetical protein